MGRKIFLAPSLDSLRRNTVSPFIGFLHLPRFARLSPPNRKTHAHTPLWRLLSVPSPAPAPACSHQLTRIFFWLARSDMFADLSLASRGGTPTVSNDAATPGLVPPPSVRVPGNGADSQHTQPQHAGTKKASASGKTAAPSASASRRRSLRRPRVPKMDLSGKMMIIVWCFIAW